MRAVVMTALVAFWCLSWCSRLGTAAAGLEEQGTAGRDSDTDAPHAKAPPVDCALRRLCDSRGECVEACARGTVAVPSWQRRAVRLQERLQASVPLCEASLPGTHNSGITLADGYGTADARWARALRELPLPDSDASVRTADQWVSLTDQLRLGVRMLEIDLHWCGGALRVAHCGGLRARPLDELLRRAGIRWDAETVGCDPPLSGLPVKDQRLARLAFEEVARFLEDEESDAVVVLFLDDQMDLKKWGLLPTLAAELEGAFGAALYAPPDPNATDARWPSAAELLAAGKRVLVASGTDYGPEGGPVFARARACGWVEPSLASFDGAPACTFGGHAVAGLVRVTASALQYGPFNAEFGRGPIPQLDAANLSAAVACGVNVPSPDGLTPALAESLVWSFAPGEDAGPGICASALAADGRWRVRPCNATLAAAACLLPSGAWALANGPTDEAGAARSCAALEAAYAPPRSARSNVALRDALAAAAVDEAWVAVPL